MLLECDLGNTRYKWRMVAEEGVIASGSGLYAEDGFKDIATELPLNRVRAASVTTAERMSEFAHYIEQCYRLKPVWAVSQPSCAGVSNAYSQPELLGVDRWLAVIAAYQLRGASLIIDVGSAITVDAVDERGQHLGGYIAPGAELMAKSLQQDTAKVRYESGSLFSSLASDLGFGHDTAAAVAAGIRAAQLGLAERAIQQARASLASDFTVLVTGGGGRQLLEDLSVAAEFAPDIVLDGLQWALP